MEKDLGQCCIVVPFILCLLVLLFMQRAKAQNGSGSAQIGLVKTELAIVRVKLDKNTSQIKCIEKEISKRKLLQTELFGQIEALKANQAFIADKASKLLCKAKSIESDKTLLLQNVGLKIKLLYKIHLERLSKSVFAFESKSELLCRQNTVKYLLGRDKLLIEGLRGQANAQSSLTSRLNIEANKLEADKEEFEKQLLSLRGEEKKLNAALANTLLKRKALLQCENRLAESRDKFEFHTVSRKKDEFSEKLNTTIKRLAFCWPVAEKNKINVRKAIEQSNFIDIEVKPNSQILASCCGKVAYKGNINGFGKIVIITHVKSFSTVYIGLDEMLVGLGQIVKQGEAIGKIIGGHGNNNILRFEVRFDNKRQSPLDCFQKCGG